MFKKITLLLFVLLISCDSSKKITKENTEYSTLVGKIINSALKYKGVKYRYGGTTKKGIDCSGLVNVTFAERGISLPRSSYKMSKKGRFVSLKNAKPGDLIFFKTNPKKPYRISHVGIITSVKNGVVEFIHSSTKRGVVLNKMNNPYYKRNFAGVRRILK